MKILFKKAEEIDIYMDVYLPSAATKEKPAPIVIFWHGGGLLQGSRTVLGPHQFNSADNHNICLVSADYRLAPQFRFPDVLWDCYDAMSYIQSPEFSEAVEGRADPSRVVVSGGSAGGWLSLLCGMGIGFDECGVPRPPKVQGIAALYPITDMLDPFWSTKQHPVSYMEKVIPREDVEPYINPNSKESRTAASYLGERRNLLYHYMVQEALLPQLLLDGTNISPAAFSVSPAIDSLKDSPNKYSVPPTYIVHGTIDDKVPVQQARDVAAALERLKKNGVNVDYEYDELEGINHLYDRETDDPMDRYYDFIKRVLRG
ncbi:alpha/beta-hydrolase, partial [Marasmius fiardii PR-910]